LSSATNLPSHLPKRGLTPAVQSFLVQLAAWLCVLPLLILASQPLLMVLLQGGLAMIFSRLLGLPTWWQAINLLFSPLVWLTLGSGIDPRWYLLGLILLTATSLGSLLTRVPLYLSSRRAVEEVARRLPDRTGIRIIDLGCGWGGLLKGLAVERIGMRLYGVEMAPLNWLVSRLRLTGRADIRLGSLWQENLADYDVVYAYLSPAPMARLWGKVQQEMRPGSLFISNSFAVPDVAPDEEVELDDLNESRLLVWRR
jgi:hypothetical protein